MAAARWREGARVEGLEQRCPTSRLPRGTSKTSCSSRTMLTGWFQAFTPLV
jgi:hypothetical protein